MVVKKLIFLSALMFVFLTAASLRPLAAATSEGKQAAPPVAGKTGGSTFSEAVKAESSSVPMEKMSGGSNAAMAPFADVKVDKASGDNAYTVAEIFSKCKQLNGKTVRVKGKVVKYNAAIMGKNWIHIQDGSGDPMTSTHDLVATSAEAATVGDVVTVQGRLAANKDFGAGYLYVAIIEDAQITK